MTPERLSGILLRLAAVEDGHPWKYEPKHEMFVGSTNALVMYDRVIQIGRDSKSWNPSTDSNIKGYTLSPESAHQNALNRALGEFLERCREDIRELLGEINK